MRQLPLSIVVCTYNRCYFLPRCLDTLLDQTLDRADYEVLVVDNNSTDATRDVLRSYETRGVRWLTESRQGLSHARNRGIAETTGEIVSFMDDDVLVDRNALRTLVEVFEVHPEVECVGGKVVPFADRPLPGWFDHPAVRAALAAFDPGGEERYLDDAHGPVGANMTFRRRLLEDVGTFRTDLGRWKGLLLSNEDAEMFSRIKERSAKSCLYHPGVSVQHYVSDERMKRRYFFARLYWQGISDFVAKGRRVVPARTTGREGLRKVLRLVAAVAREPPMSVVLHVAYKMGLLSAPAVVYLLRRKGI